LMFGHFLNWQLFWLLLPKFGQFFPQSFGYPGAGLFLIKSHQTSKSHYEIGRVNNT
jgi:hypothetical protein